MPEPDIPVLGFPSFLCLLLSSFLSGSRFITICSVLIFTYVYAQTCVYDAYFQTFHPDS